MSGGAFDAAIVGWLAVGVVLGTLTGFFRSAARVAGLVVAFWVADATRAPVTSFLGNLGLRSWLASFWQRTGVLPESLSAIPVDAGLGDRLPDLLGQLHIPLEYADRLYSPLQTEIERATATGVTTVGAVLANMLGEVVIDAAAFLTVFFVVHVMVDVVGRILQGTLGRLPFIGAGNRLGGAALGGIQHLFHVVLVVGILLPVAGFLPGMFGEALVTSKLAPLMGEIFRLTLIRFVL